jgi:hypothetical protein
MSREDAFAEDGLTHSPNGPFSPESLPYPFSTSGESSFGDLYIEGHRVGPAGVLDDKLVLPVLLRRELNRTLRSGRVVLSGFRACGVVDEKVHVGILQAVRGGRHKVRSIAPRLAREWLTPVNRSNYAARFNEDVVLHPYCQ